MNCYICMYKCGKCSRCFDEIFQSDGNWYISSRSGSGESSYLRIQEPADFFKDTPRGWAWRKTKYGDVFEFVNWSVDSDYVKSMWQVHLHPECGCPFYAEHFMSEIKHEGRLKKWGEWNDKMRRLYGRCKKEDEDGKADGKKLP